MNIQEYISKLLTILTSSDQPTLRAFGFLLADMRREFTTDVQTMAVDGVTFFVNPTWPLDRSDLDNLFTLCHEAMHVYGRHPERLRDALEPHEIVHKAADYSVNLTLEKSNIPFDMPEDGLINRDYVDSNGNALNVERIIPLLKQPEQPEQPESGDDGESGADTDPGESGESDGESQPAESPEQGDDTGDSESGDSDGDSEDGQDGESGQDGDSDSDGDSDGDGDGDSEDGDSGSCGELLPAPEDMDPDDSAKKAIQATTLAKAGGHSLPDWLEVAVSDMAQHSPSDWLDQLRDRFANAVDDSDYTFKRFSQKYLQIGMIAPTLYNDGIGKVAIVGDESSSMSDDQLNKVTAQTAAILEQWSPEETLILRHTSQIVFEDVLQRGQEPMPRKKRAHGGTDFMPVIDRCEADGVEVIIWITDCFPCDDPRQSEVPVIWLGTDSHSEYAWKNYLGYGDFIQV